MNQIAYFDIRVIEPVPDSGEWVSPVVIDPEQDSS